jgi:glucose/arabinose dehydrogenase
MFDVLPHPQFAENGLIYLSYAVERPGPGGGRLNATAIARGRLSGNALLDVSEIYVRNPLRPGGMHYGGRMLFLPDGSLLLTLGDGYRFREEAQDKAGQLGKTVRMTDAGAPAPDNPFASDAAADPFVYSLGHRNIQGAALDRATGRVYLHEHGPLGGDEINVLKAGVNYGWPVITYGKDYNGATISPFTQRPGMAQPILHWTPSIAPSGLAFYDGALFPQWRGDLFAGGLKDGLVHRIDLDGEGRVLAEETLFAEIGARIRDVRQGPDGALYVLTDELDGRIIRVVPAA